MEGCTEMTSLASFRTVTKSEERFWAKVDKTKNGCWLWTAGCNGDGYGSYSWDGRVQGTHRIAWQIENGPIPEGLNVLHHCDTPPCVNVAHLFLGTQLDNVRDCAAKGRNYKSHGEQHHSAQLCEETIHKIRALQGVIPHREIATQFGVSGSAVSHILAGHSWTHLPNRATNQHIRRKGEHHKTQLCSEDILQIRVLRSVLTFDELAAQFQVSKGAIWNIVTRRTWKHVT